MSDNASNTPKPESSGDSSNRNNNRSRNRGRGRGRKPQDGGEGSTPSASSEQSTSQSGGSGPERESKERSVSKSRGQSGNRNRNANRDRNADKGGEESATSIPHSSGDENKGRGNRNNRNRGNRNRNKDVRDNRDGRNTSARKTSKDVKATPMSEEFQTKLEEQSSMLDTQFDDVSTSEGKFSDKAVEVYGVGEKPIIGITTGDLNGIGLEVVLKTLSDLRITELCTPVIFGGSKSVNYHKKALDGCDFNFQLIHKVSEAREGKINLLNVWSDNVEINLGQPTDVSGQYALMSIDAALESARNGEIHAMVTAPINKFNIAAQMEGFTGHTGYLAEKLDSSVLMILCTENLRVATVTGHIPIAKVAESLTSEKIESAITVLAESLRKDFGIVRPTIGVLGLNPHAGEMGTIGSEEETIIAPAISAQNKDNVIVRGPFPADGFFGQQLEYKFDAVLGMYHDQVLVPFKSIAMGGGVNFSAGLPVVRTSPDHGTAMSLAGKQQADESSFRLALYMAIDVYKRRKGYEEMTSNPLEKQKR